MSFQDLLNQPLPSKTVEESVDNETTFDAEATLSDIEESVADMLEENEELEESSEDTFDADAVLESIETEILESMDECGDNCETEEETEPITAEPETPTTEDDDDDDDDVVTDDDDDFDVDDLSDAEIAALDAELGGDTLDDVSGEEDEEELTPEEEIEADDMMKVAATTMLVNDELNAEERVAFLSNEAEVGMAINEGFLSETDVNQLALESGLITEAHYNNKMIIKLDAASKKKQLYALAVNVSAAAHNDKDYIKLKKVMKMRKILRARLEKKYKTEATKRMKIYFKRLRSSKSQTLSGIGNKDR